ncbi:MAG: TonB-dependent receptor, partial [Flavobacteriales bacterium]
SLGASVLLHNLFEKNNVITYAKLRGGYAQIPSDIGVLTTNPQYRTGNQPLTVGSSLYPIVNLPTSRVDPNLKPAINVNREIGLDLKFLKNRLTFGATYYDEDRKDEPIPVSLASSSGAQSLIINASSANRKGIELNLSGDVFRNSEGLNWTTSLNFARNKSMITKVHESLDRIAIPPATNYSSFSYVQILQMEGYEWGQLYGTGIKRDNNGNAVINTNGTYAVETDKAFGSVLPKFTGGFFNSVSYKGITLSATIDFQKGGKFFSLSEQWGTSGGLLEATAAMNDRGHNVRDDVADGGGVHVMGVNSAGGSVDMYVDAHTYFAQYNANRLAEPFIHDASYIKLREVALSYELPKSIFQKTGVNFYYQF